jgi:prevent-host-death family protein
MSERRIGIREFKSKLSQFLREVRTGSIIIITDHGRRVARLVPESDSLEERIDALRTAGSIQWSGRRLDPAGPAVRARGKRTVADIVVENRE